MASINASHWLTDYQWSMMATKERCRAGVASGNPTGGRAEPPADRERRPRSVQARPARPEQHCPCASRKMDNRMAKVALEGWRQVKK
jgi:hypothetical protein